MFGGGIHWVNLFIDIYKYWDGKTDYQRISSFRSSGWAQVSLASATRRRQLLHKGESPGSWCWLWWSWRKLIDDPHLLSLNKKLKTRTFTSLSYWLENWNSTTTSTKTFSKDKVKIKQHLCFTCIMVYILVGLSGSDSMQPEQSSLWLPREFVRTDRERKGE